MDQLLVLGTDLSDLQDTNDDFRIDDLVYVIPVHSLLSFPLCTDTGAYNSPHVVASHFRSQKLLTIELN